MTIFVVMLLLTLTNRLSRSLSTHLLSSAGNDIKHTLRKQVIDNILTKSEQPTNKDIDCVATRQLGYSIQDQNMLAVEKSRCNYGFPRAIVRFPVGNGIQSGMIRLTCPHLVKAIDEFEADGGINKINTKLSQESDKGNLLRNNFLNINSAWKTIRNMSVTDEDRELVKKTLPISSYDHFFGTGIIGITLNKVDDVKCLHAHTADYLVRGDNKIGEWTLKELEKRGVSAGGCSGKNTLNKLYAYRYLYIILV